VGAEGDGQQEDDEGKAKDVGHDFSKGFVGARSPRPMSLCRRYWAGDTTSWHKPRPYEWR
ncbi:MAG: hypothetical protein KDD74_05095, partial [Anaerolineales bacterium]|nr:hypothetical protein [Anaerolineales bacterium]